jgi:hypothetical protein
MYGMESGIRAQEIILWSGFSVHDQITLPGCMTGTSTSPFPASAKSCWAWTVEYRPCIHPLSFAMLDIVVGFEAEILASKTQRSARSPSLHDVTSSMGSYGQSVAFHLPQRRRHPRWSVPLRSALQ